MSSIYVAAPYAAREWVRENVAEPLRAAGHRITSDWLQESTPIEAGTLAAAVALADDQVMDHVHSDVFGVAKADMLVMVTPDWIEERSGAPVPVSSSGGRHVEFGIALAYGKRLMVLGDPENVFARACAISVSTVEDLLEEVAR